MREIRKPVKKVRLETDKISQIVNEVVGTYDMDKNNLLCKLPIIYIINIK